MTGPYPPPDAHQPDDLATGQHPSHQHPAGAPPGVSPDERYDVTGPDVTRPADEVAGPGGSQPGTAPRDPLFTDGGTADRGAEYRNVGPAEPVQPGADHRHPDPAQATPEPRPGATEVQPGGEDRERLVPRERAESYGARWDAVKATFVDEPRQAVAQADALVGELLADLERLFREQRRDLEHGLDADATSTEDLRLALGRYRSFFDRLLSL